MKSNSPKSWWNRINPRWLLVVPTVVTVIITIALMRWSIPLHVHVELTTQRVGFVVDASQGTTQPILNGLNVRSLGVESFSSIAFEPETLEVADPSAYSVEKDAYPSTAWQRLEVTTPKVGFEVTDLASNPRVTVEETDDSAQTGLRLDPIGVASGVRVSLETRGRKDDGLAITVAGPLSINVSNRSSIALIAQNIGMSGVRGPRYEGRSELTYRARLRESAPWIEIAGRRDGMVILPTVQAAQLKIELLSG